MYGHGNGPSLSPPRSINFLGNPLFGVDGLSSFGGIERGGDSNATSEGDELY